MMKQKMTLVQLVLIFISNMAFATVRLEYEAKVLNVIDGNTLMISNRVSKTGIEISSVGTLELDGIDAPDLDQPGGKMAHECLKRMVNGLVVSIIEVSDNGHSRGVWVFHRDQTNCVNLLMVQKGMAWWKEPNITAVVPLDKMTNAQERARASKLGLWSLDNPVPPWQWRKERIERDQKKTVPSATE